MRKNPDEHLPLSLCSLSSKIVPSMCSIDDFTTLVPHLVYLRAKLSQMKFSMTTKVLLSRLPSSLRELSLSTWSIDYADGLTWENVLSNFFPQLKRFRLIISLDRTPASCSVDTQEDRDRLVASFNQSSYFLDRHWHALLNVCKGDRLEFVMHTSPYPIENFQTSLYDVLRCNLSPALVHAAYQSVSKLTLTLLHDPEPIPTRPTDNRCFSHVEQLIFLSNLTSDTQAFQPKEYLKDLMNIIDLSTITTLRFPEETNHYPLEFIGPLIDKMPRLVSLAVPHRLFAGLPTQSLTSLTLLFTIYARSSYVAERIQHLFLSNQILTNQVIDHLLRLVPSSFSHLKVLTLVARDMDEYLSNYLRTMREGVSYELFPNNHMVRFYF